ncbi:troponin C, skeletal muscle-like isoform X2 [Littorina saxatilis]|uniref:EF-hand domain-containing protein n=2 Tax=Littorina saxatilis TaxID=31220 RepID=A0AAN9BUC9_9CAEN
MAHLTAKERQLYSHVFLSMDVDGNGWLDSPELAEGCRRLGFTITDEQAAASFNAIDTNHDGRVTLDEFLAVMGHIEQSNPKAKKEAKLRRSFREMDVDEDGLLSEKELMDGLRDAGYNLSRDQAKRLCNDLDKNGDGKIDFEEFISMFQL